MKKNKKILSYKTVALVVVIISIVSVSFYIHRLNQNEQLVNDAVDQLNSILVDQEEKYIELEVLTETEIYNYKFQVYDAQNNYYILNSNNETVEFIFESYCENNKEYVKTNYTAGFELLNTNDCSDKTPKIATGFAGFDFTTFNSKDFDIKKDGENATLTAKKGSLSNSLFLGEFVNEDPVEFSNFVITTKKDSTSLTTKFNHPEYGEMTISLSVEFKIVLDVPEYK